MTDTTAAAVLARIRQMADYWEQHLPDVIRTPAVVSALRAAMEPAEQPPTDRAACVHPEGYDGECPCPASCGCCKVAPPADRAACQWPAGEPYWLELDPERAAVLRADLAGPEGEQPPADRAARVTLNRGELATLLAHHADVLAASLHADARSGPAELRAGVAHATELLTLHANAMTADEETSAVAEILDAAFEFPEWLRHPAAEVRRDDEQHEPLCTPATRPPHCPHCATEAQQ